ncbi:MAG: redoxin family protein [Streptosporangiales bacterium]|nr:redoxin family protein [Streptosporangiales bacterium]
MASDPMALPPDLPVPVDDGAAAHLPGTPMPALALPSTAGGPMRVDQVPDGFDRLVVYAYPWTGQPGKPLLTPEWDLIPGARGCTPEACSFRDHAAELREAGAAVVGLSTQEADYQREAAERLHLPFPLLNDAELRLAEALGLPTFAVEGRVLLKRLTLVIRAGEIEHVFYPVFPPNTHAEEVLAWLRAAS